MKQQAKKTFATISSISVSVVVTKRFISFNYQHPVNLCITDRNHLFNFKFQEKSEHLPVNQPNFIKRFTSRPPSLPSDERMTLVICSGFQIITTKTKTFSRIFQFATLQFLAGEAPG